MLRGLNPLRFKHVTDSDGSKSSQCQPFNLSKRSILMQISFLKISYFLAPTETHTIVQWEDLEARLIRPNLKCTNGYIHVIDKVRFYWPQYRNWPENCSKLKENIFDMHLNAISKDYSFRQVLLKRRDVTLGGGNGATSFGNHHLSFLVTATLLLYTSSISL